MYLPVALINTMAKAACRRKGLLELMERERDPDLSYGTGVMATSSQGRKLRGHIFNSQRSTESTLQVGPSDKLSKVHAQGHAFSRKAAPPKGSVMSAK